MSDLANYQIQLPTVEEIQTMPTIRFFEHCNTYIETWKLSDDTFRLVINGNTSGAIYPITDEGIIQAQKEAQSVWTFIINTLIFARDCNQFRSWEKTLLYQTLNNI